MLLTGDSIKGLNELSEYNTLKDLHRQVMSQIDKQNKALESIANVLKKTVESLETSDSKVTSALNKVSLEIHKGIKINEMPKSESSDNGDEYEYIQKLAGSIDTLTKFVEMNNRIMGQISSFDQNVSAAIAKLNMKEVKQQLEKLNKTIESRDNGRWEFEIVRNVGGYMTSVVAKKS